MRSGNPAPRRGLAAALTALVHLLFFALIAYSVNWKTHAPEPVMVELWQPPAPVPAAPPTPLPPEKVTQTEPPKAEPVMPNPDIALEEQKRKLAAQQARQAELLAQQQAEAEKLAAKQKKAQEKQLAAQQLAAQKLADQQVAEQKLAAQQLAKKKLAAQKKILQQKKQAALRQMVEQQTRAEFSSESARALNSSRQAALASRQSAEQAQMSKEYQDKIKAKIRGKIILPEGLQGNPHAEIDVSVLPSGDVTDVKLTHSSGQPAYDEAVERAILKASPLPMPPNPAVAQQFRNLDLTFSPNEN